jgi:hypothetical protein
VLARDVTFSEFFEVRVHPELAVDLGAVAQRVREGEHARVVAGGHEGDVELGVRAAPLHRAAGAVVEHERRALEHVVRGDDGGFPLDAAVLDRAAQGFALEHHPQLGERDEVRAGGLDHPEPLVGDEHREVALGETAERLAHHGLAGVVPRGERGEPQWHAGWELAAQDVRADGVVDLSGPRRRLGGGHGPTLTPVFVNHQIFGNP